MGEIIYNKLVRDKIPEILQAKGIVCNIRIIDGDEYNSELNKKLKEELDEYFESGEIEELADIEEVLRAILDYKNVSYEEFEEIRLQKQKRRGGFKLKVFLESTSE